MKNIIYLIAVVLLFHTGSRAQSSGGDPGLTAISFQHTSIPVGGSTIFTMELGNKSITGPIPAGSFAVQISFGRAGNPASPSYVPEPLDVSAISLIVPDANYFATDPFTWAYDATTNTFVGILHTEIPVLRAYKIQIPVKGVVANAAGVQTNTQIQIMDSQGISDNIANNVLLLSLPVEAAQPVTLTHFTAKKENTSSALSWATADEVNSDRFEVQRSFDNKSWHKLGDVDAYGDSNTPRNYQFTDESPANGENYYRLKMIDKDGSFEMSKHQSLVFEGLEGITVYPNPTADLVNLKINDAQAIQKVVLQSVSGQVLYTSTQDTQKPINLRPYAAGTYLIMVHRNDGRITTHKIVKQ